MTGAHVHYAWLHSLRRCLKFKAECEELAVNYKLFQLLQAIIKKTKPLKIKKVEEKLRTEILRAEDWVIKAHFGPSWWYIEQALDSCVGAKIPRKEMPYTLMAAIQDNRSARPDFARQIQASW